MQRLRTSTWARETAPLLHPCIRLHFHGTPGLHVDSTQSAVKREGTNKLAELTTIAAKRVRTRVRVNISKTFTFNCARFFKTIFVYCWKWVWFYLNFKFFAALQGFFGCLMCSQMWFNLSTNSVQESGMPCLFFTGI